jgi:hypothetical protein
MLPPGCERGVLQFLPVRSDPPYSTSAVACGQGCTTVEKWGQVDLEQSWKISNKHYERKSHLKAYNMNTDHLRHCVSPPGISII